MALEAIKPADFHWFPLRGVHLLPGARRGRARLDLRAHRGEVRPGDRQDARSRGPCSEQARTAYAKVLDHRRGRRAVAVRRHPHHRERHALRPAALRGGRRRARRALRRAPADGDHGRAWSGWCARTAFLEVELRADQGRRDAAAGGRARSAPPAPGCRRRSSRGTTGPCTCRRWCRSTQTATSSRPATSSASTATAWSRPTCCCARSGLSLDNARHHLRLLDPRHAARCTARRTGSRKELLGNGGVYPGAGGILMSRLHHPEQLVAIDVDRLAAPAGAGQPGLVALRHPHLRPGREGRPDAVHVRLRRPGHGDAGGAAPRRPRRAGRGDLRGDPAPARRTPASARSTCSRPSSSAWSRSCATTARSPPVRERLLTAAVAGLDRRDLRATCSAPSSCWRSSRPPSDPAEAALMGRCSPTNCAPASASAGVYTAPEAFGPPPAATSAWRSATTTRSTPTRVRPRRTGWPT